MTGFRNMTALIEEGGFFCESCGKKHTILLKGVSLRRGAVNDIPSQLNKLGAVRPFILCDPNTYEAAGKKVCGVLSNAGTEYSLYILHDRHPAPDEKALGEAVMRFDPKCDSIIGIGGGVVNDICKLMTNLTKRPYIYCATAPSMDGYASSSSSMEALGLKTSINSAAADMIIADTDIIAAAPKDMILSGIGDMCAKYISLAEWKMAHIITGEYYCPEVAEMVRMSLESVVNNASEAVHGNPDAVASVTEGLILAGLAMTCAGVSRPASGMEHYISHIRDMRGLAKGTRVDFHGIQCGFAVIPCLREYEKLAKTVPNREKALSHAEDFDYSVHADAMREFVGEGAGAMIALEAKEGKYDTEKHAARLDRIISHWDELTAVMRSLPSSEDYISFCRGIGFPTEPRELEMTENELANLMRFAGDVRDKYVLSRLVWDLGE